MGVNILRSQYRRSRSEQRAYERLAHRKDAPLAADPVHHLIDVRLAQALSQLPRGQRQAIALHYAMDMSISEAAEALGLAESTVRVQLHRGRIALRACFQLDQDTQEEKE